MLRLTVFAACIAWLGLGSTQAQVSLQIRVPEGKTLVTEAGSSVVQKLTIAGQVIDTNADTQTVLKGVAGKRDADGNIRVRESVESLKITMGGAAGDYSFDSKQLDQTGTSALEVLRDIHKALARRTVVKVYNKDNRVEKVEAEDLIGGLPVEVQQLVRDQVDPEQVKKAANQEIEQLPKAPVQPGDQWTRTQEVNFGAGQRMVIESQFTYEGPVTEQNRTLHKIVGKALNVQFFLENSPLPLTLKDSKLKVGETKNELWYDAELGIIVKSEAVTQFTGEMTFSVNDMDLPSTLDLTIRGTSVTK